MVTVENNDGDAIIEDLMLMTTSSTYQFSTKITQKGKWQL